MAAGVDDLTAHVGGGGGGDGELGGVGVGGIDDAAVDGALADGGGDLLDVRAVGQLVGDGGLVDIIELEDLLGVLADGDVRVADGELHIDALEEIGELIETVDALGIAVRDGEGNLVFQQIDAAAREEHVQTVGVLLGVILERAVELVHLLGGGGDEQVTDGALLDLLIERTGGVIVEDERHILVIGHVLFTDGVEGLGEGGGGEHGQRDPVTVGARLGVIAAGHERERHDQRQQQGYKFFHRFVLPFMSGCFCRIIGSRGDTGAGEKTPRAGCISKIPCGMCRRDSV